MESWITAHSLMFLLALATLVTAAWIWLRRERLGLRPVWIVPLSMMHVAWGVLCVKLFAAVESFSPVGFQKMSLFGAVFLLPPIYWLGAKLSRRKTADVFDVFTVPTVFTLACARVNCLISGCCLGAVILGTQSRWPTREAELVFYAILLPWLIVRSKKKEAEGSLWPAYMAAYGAFRFATEFFRESGTASVLHLSHLWAILCMLIGISILLEMDRRQHTGTKSNHPNQRRKRK